MVLRLSGTPARLGPVRARLRAWALSSTPARLGPEQLTRLGPVCCRSCASEGLVLCVDELGLGLVACVRVWVWAGRAHTGGRTAGPCAGAHSGCCWDGHVYKHTTTIDDAGLVCAGPGLQPRGRLVRGVRCWASLDARRLFVRCRAEGVCVPSGTHSTGSAAYLHVRRSCEGGHSACTLLSWPAPSATSPA